jgi:hypothetical protein
LQENDQTSINAEKNDKQLAEKNFVIEIIKIRSEYEKKADKSVSNLQKLCK